MKIKYNFTFLFDLFNSYFGLNARPRWVNLITTSIMSNGFRSK